jgi:hypothetical protein
MLADVSMADSPIPRHLGSLRRIGSQSWRPVNRSQGDAVTAHRGSELRERHWASTRTIGLANDVAFYFTRLM